MSEPKSISSKANRPSSYNTTQTGDTVIGEKIKLYERFRKLVKVLFVLFFLTAVIYVAYSVTDNSISYTAIKIENQVVSSTDGKLLALSVINNGLRSILISTDGGKHFKIEGGPWAIKDSIAKILITPDRNAITVTDGSDQYYINMSPFDNFKKYNLQTKPSTGNYSITGMFYSAAYQSVYLFGDMPFLAKISLKNPSQQSNIALPSIDYTVVSFATNNTGLEAKAIVINNKTKDTAIWNLKIDGKDGTAVFIPEPERNVNNDNIKLEADSAGINSNNSKK